MIFSKIKHHVKKYLSELLRSLRRLCFYRCLYVHRGGVHGGGVCVAGGMCMAEGVTCMAERGMHGRGGMCGRGAGMVGVCMIVHVACTTPTGRYYEIWSMSGRDASYWNGFLFTFVLRCRELEFKLSFLEHYEERKSDQVYTRQGLWVGCVLNIH